MLHSCETSLYIHTGTIHTYIHTYVKNFIAKWISGFILEECSLWLEIRACVRPSVRTYETIRDSTRKNTSKSVIGEAPGKIQRAILHQLSQFYSACTALVNRFNNTYRWSTSNFEAGAIAWYYNSTRVPAFLREEASGCFSARRISFRQMFDLSGESCGCG